MWRAYLTENFRNKWQLCNKVFTWFISSCDTFRNLMLPLALEKWRFHNYSHLWFDCEVEKCFSYTIKFQTYLFAGDNGVVLVEGLVASEKMEASSQLFDALRIPRFIRLRVLLLLRRMSRMFFLSLLLTLRNVYLLRSAETSVCYRLFIVLHLYNYLKMAFLAVLIEKNILL